jgi:hypothetical protein
MTKLMVFLAMVIAMLTFAVRMQAHVAIGTMAGTVLDSHGRPVTGATVTMQASWGNRPDATHTDANGHFAFARHRTGQYDLRAYSKGVFSEWVKWVYIREGRTTEVTLRLPPAADESVVVTH